jgi:hypothetical protein
MQTAGTAYNKTIQILGYAGDTVLVGRVTCVLKETILILSKAAQESSWEVKVAGA